MIDVCTKGFSPNKSAGENHAILQAALDCGGTISISEPGIYDIDDVLLIGSFTTLVGTNGVTLRKVGDKGGFTHVLLNRGALTKTWDEHIRVEGIRILVNNITGKILIGGLRGQLAFHYIRDLTVTDVRIPDLEPSNFGIHICTFEDIRVTDCHIMGKKDGVHLGRGKRFLISGCVFDTFDDAVALNAHDYDSSNPELGCIEDGVVEKCWDIAPERAVGFFCRILAGAWVDWFEGMEVQKSDSVISNGRLYRVFAKADGQKFISKTRPTHESGSMILDGIDWHMVQEDVVYEAAVRNVTFRDIFLYKPRPAFSVHFDHDKWSRSFYPGAVNPLQEQLVFDNIRVLHDGGNDFIIVGTPVDSLLVTNCALRENKIVFFNPANLEHPGDTRLTVQSCAAAKPMKEMIVNRVPQKEVHVTLDGEKYSV